jgi:regulator of sigma E protease
VYSAPFYAFGETYRMAKMTGVLFVDFLKQFFGTGELPPTVSGPVGIAQMTGAFAREGFIPLIRFIAILSISLAVLNIFPFPALDGGKLIFLVIEFFAGRKVSPKWENYIHMVGYFLIILLVLAITYKDILRVFV